MKLLRPIKKEDSILLIIDPQVDFCSKEGKFGRYGNFSKIEKTIDKILYVHDKLEKRGFETALFKQVYDPENMDPLKVDLTKKKSGRGSCDIRTDGHNFYRVTLENKRVFTKYGYYNCFLEDSFMDYLQRKEVKSIIVTGFDTHICVESTVRAGYDLGYQMVLVTDCIGGRAGVKRQENSIDTMSRYFAVPIQSQDLFDVIDLPARKQRGYYKTLATKKHEGEPSDLRDFF